MDAFRLISIRIRALLALAALLGSGAASAQTAIVIGGALRMDNDPVWTRIVQEAGGPGKAHFAVLATAAANPELSAKLIIDVLKKHGAQAEHIPVAPRLEGADLQKNLNDPELIAKVRASNAVFFSGGAQGFIVDTLQPDGRRTAMLDAIWDVYRRGGVVAGTSAGAAIMSRVMFRDALNVMEVMRGTLREGQEIDRGLGFVGDELFVDQHFLKRGRIGRMLPLMMAKGYRFGLGVEENSAAVVHGDRIDVIGGRGALFVDLRDARSDPSLGMFNVRGARISYLDNGDRHDLRSGVTMPAARKTAAGAPVPIHASTQGGTSPSRGPVDSFQPDILGDNRIVQAMTELLSSPAAEVRAMAARIRPDAKGDRDRTGFVFRLYRGADTQGWIDADGDGQDVTLLDVRLDIRPVRLPDPGAPGPTTNAVPAATMIAPAGMR